MNNDLSAMADVTDSLKSSPIAKILAQIEQNTRSEKTAVLYKTRQELGAGKVQVKIRATIHAITDIDNLKQEFTANLTVRARWKEPLFHDCPVTQDIDWDDQWNPRIELENAVAIKNFDRKYDLRYFNTDKEDKIPHVCLKMSISATFKEMFELEEFPIDYQALNIWLISEWSFDQLDLVNDEEVMDHLTLTTFTESKEWMLYPQVIGEPVGEPEDIKEVFGSPEQFPLYTITTHVKRLHQFYLWNYVLYMFLIFLLSLTTFSIPLEEVSQRLIAAAVILVSALLYRLYIQPAIPVVAYWTALDKYNMALMLCHILVILEHAVMGGIAVMSNPQDLVNVDLACILAIVAIMLTVNCYFAAFLFQTIKKRDKFLKEETKNFEELNEKILKNYNTRTGSKWKYEPPADEKKRPDKSENGSIRDRKSNGTRDNGSRHTAASTQLSRMYQSLPPSRRVRSRSRERSIPSSPTLKSPRSARRPPIPLNIRPELTHEVRINITDGERPRSRSESRGRRLRNNKVHASSDDQANSDYERVN